LEDLFLRHYGDGVSDTPAAGAAALSGKAAQGAGAR
jgi:hypothetical protein